MIQVELIPFQQSLNKVYCEVTQNHNHFSIKYHVELSSTLELWEKPNSSLERKIGLWEGTCFEAFLRNETTNQYLEFNFSGTGWWNAFLFEKKGQDLSEYLPIKIESHRFIKSKRFRSFEFSVKTSLLPFDFNQGKFSLGLSTILVNDHHEKEYFALKHLKDQPDFHDENTYLKLELD